MVLIKGDDPEPSRAVVLAVQERSQTVQVRFYVPHPHWVGYQVSGFMKVHALSKCTSRVYLGDLQEIGRVMAKCLKNFNGLCSCFLSWEDSCSGNRCLVTGITFNN